MAILHGQLSTGWVRQPDSTASCGRMGDVGACGTYFPVTDHIGKVVVMVDSQARIAGTGECDPFGQVNRTSIDKETPHPYTAAVADFAEFMVPAQAGTTTQMRVKFQALDVQGGTCPGPNHDSVNIIDNEEQVISLACSDGVFRDNDNEVCGHTSRSWDSIKINQNAYRNAHVPPRRSFMNFDTLGLEWVIEIPSSIRTLKSLGYASDVMGQWNDKSCCSSVCSGCLGCGAR